MQHDKEIFKENSIPFLERSITDEKNLEDAKATGFTQMPIVVLSEKTMYLQGLYQQNLKSLWHKKERITMIVVKKTEVQWTTTQIEFSEL